MKSINHKGPLIGTSILIPGVLFIPKYPLPSLPPGGKELASNGAGPTVSPLGEIRKGVVFDQRIEYQLCTKLVNKIPLCSLVCPLCSLVVKNCIAVQV
jgi:hypothetical protein